MEFETWHQQRARLFAVDDLDNVDSAIALVANLGNDDGSQAGAIDALATITADKFAFV